MDEVDSGVSTGSVNGLNLDNRFLLPTCNEEQEVARDGELAAAGRSQVFAVGAQVFFGDAQVVVLGAQVSDGRAQSEACVMVKTGIVGQSTFALSLIEQVAAVGAAWGFKKTIGKLQTAAVIFLAGVFDVPPSA